MHPADLSIPDSAAPLRAQVERLEAHLSQMPQAQIPLIHGFGPGFYARSVLLPAGTLATGKVHKTRHIFMVTHGDLSLTTDSGTVRVQAPYMAICEPGTKRAVLAHSDTVCVNIHITEEQDVALLESTLVETPALPAPEGEI